MAQERFGARWPAVIDITGDQSFREPKSLEHSQGNRGGNDQADNDHNDDVVGSSVPFRDRTSA
jgi:hypothetical protein